YHVPQGAETVLTLQNRETEKEAISASGARIVPYEKVASEDDVRIFMETHGSPVIVKTATGGYDGKGQYLLERDADIDAAGISVGDTAFVAVTYISLEREVSLTISRSMAGQVIHFPLQEKLHKDQVLYGTIVPTSVDYAEEAQKEVAKIMDALHFV